jgi:hypothetical protein
MLTDFLDIEVEKEIVEEVSTQKPLSMFSYLEDINFSKKGNIHIDRDPSMKQFNTFMILRYLSLEKNFCSLINILDKFQANLSKEEMYKLLILLIPRGRRFLQYPKTSKDEIDEGQVKLAAKYFEISFNEAKEFIKLKLLSNFDLEQIKEAYGGKMDKKGKLK